MMRFAAILFALLLCVSARAQKTPTYSTNDFSITSSNLLGSNILAGSGIKLAKDAKGRLTASTIASATDTNLDNLTVTNTARVNSSLIASNATVSGLITGQTFTADRVLVSGANKHIRTDDAVDTNEVNYLDGVTNSIQTQLNAKSPVGAWISFTPNITALAVVDATTHYFGAATAASATYNDVRIYVTKACTLKGFFFRAVASVVGSGETASFYVRINDTTDVAQIDVTLNATFVTGNNTSVSQALAAGDYIVIKLAAQTYATNPSIRIYPFLYVE